MRYLSGFIVIVLQEISGDTECAELGTRSGISAVVENGERSQTRRNRQRQTWSGVGGRERGMGNVLGRKQKASKATMPIKDG